MSYCNAFRMPQNAPENIAFRRFVVGLLLKLSRQHPNGVCVDPKLSEISNCNFSAVSK